MFTDMFKAKRLIAVLISATMAWPAPSWSSSVDIDGGDTTEGIPVILQPMTTPDGRVAYLAIAPIPVELEAEFITAAGKHDPERTVLVVSGPDDPALKAARKTGFLEKIRTFVADKVENSPLAKAKQLSSNVKGKFVSAVNNMSAFLKDKQKQFAIVMTLYVAGVNGTFTFVESSSVSSALSVFGAVMAWIGFQTMFTEYWEKLLHKGGDLFVDVFAAAAGLIGRELSETSKRLYATAGSFYVPWVANTAMVTWIFTRAGTYESLLAAVLYGFAISYDIYDKGIATRINRGLLASKWLARFVALRVFLGTIFDVMSYSHVPYMQLGLTVLTGTGVLWLALGTEFEDRVVNRAKRISIGVRDLKNSVVGAAASIRAGCQALLRSPTGEGP